MRSIQASNIRVGDTLLNTKGDKVRGTVARIVEQPIMAWKSGGEAYQVDGQYALRFYNDADRCIADLKPTTRVKVQG